MAPRVTPKPRDRRATKLKGVGLGAELAAALVGFTLLGLWLDRSFDTAPWALLISLAVGTIGGFYNFLRASLRELQPPPTSVQSQVKQSREPSPPKNETDN